MAISKNAIVNKQEDRAMDWRNKQIKKANEKSKRQ